MGLLLGPFSTPGLSEDNSPIQVVPTPTALVPHFQVFLLDLLKVLQQLGIVDAGGVCRLRLGGCLQTVPGEGCRKAQHQRLRTHGGGGQHQTQEGKATGWWDSTLGSLSASGPATPPRQPHSVEEPREHPLPCSWGDQSTLPLGYGLQPVGWQQSPGQASHWEAFPVYEWLPLG